MCPYDSRGMTGSDLDSHSTLREKLRPWARTKAPPNSNFLVTLRLHAPTGVDTTRMEVSILGINLPPFGDPFLPRPGHFSNELSSNLISVPQPTSHLLDERSASARRSHREHNTPTSIEGSG